jgi:hypothetical protein
MEASVVGTIKGVVLCGVVAFASLACESKPMSEPADGVDAAASAPDAVPANHRGSLPLRDFRAITEAPAAKATRVAAEAIPLTRGGRRELVSPPMWTSHVGDEAVVDVRLPTLSANPSWTGELKLFVSDESVAGGQRYLGGYSLTPLEGGITHRLRVPLSAEAKPLLSAGGRLKIVLQVPADSPPFFVEQVSVDGFGVKGLAATSTVHVKLPSLASAANTIVAGGTSVDVRDGVTLSGPAGLTLTSLGSVELGADSVTAGDVRAVGNVFLRERAKIKGSLVSQTSYTHQNQWTVEGGVFAPQSVSPYSDEPLIVRYPASAQPISLEPDQQASFAPGAYTALTLKPRAKLTLAPGDYYFDSAQIEPTAELRLQDPSRPVVLHVRGQLTHRGSMPNALPANVLWMVTGTSAVEMGAPLVGTVLAPEASVRLAPTNGVAHRGALFGKSVTVEAASPFQLVAFSGWQQLLRPRDRAHDAPTTSFRARWVYPSGEPVQSFSYGPAPSQFRVLAGGQPGEAATDALSFEVQNLTAAMGGMTVAYSVIMKSWGLGNFYSDVTLQAADANVTLSPGQKRTIDVPSLPNTLGVKATDMPAKGDIVIGLHRLNAGAVEAAPFAYLRMPQFFYHFSDDFTKVFTYSLERASDALAPSGMVPKDGVVERYAQGVYTANLFAPAGKLGSSTSQQARDSLLAQYGDRPAQLYGIRWDAQLPGETPHPVIPPGATMGGSNEPYNPNDGPTGVCATWPTVFVDNGAEAFPVPSQAEFKGIVDFLPAAFNRAQLFKADGTPVQEGFLDQNGCFAQPLELGKGNYLLRVFSSGMTNNGVRVNITRFEPPQTGSTDKEVSVTYALYVNAPGHSGSGGFTTFSVTTGMWTETTHVAGFAGHLLSRDQQGVDFGLTRGTAASPVIYKVQLNTSNISQAGASGLSINAFLTENQWVSDARWKFVLAHEFGHVVAAKGKAMLGGGYTFSGNDADPTFSDWSLPPDSDSAQNQPDDCTCNVIEAGDNRLHCLQSIELTSSAQNEAFGHFIASRVWNLAPIDAAYGNGACHFSYYKQVSAADLVTSVSLPPVSVDCGTARKHRKMKCGGVAANLNGQPAELSSEFDWLTFFRALTTNTQTPVTVGDILSWYRTACNGDCNGTQQVLFANFRDAAPAGVRTFINDTAAAHGVD